MGVLVAISSGVFLAFFVGAVRGVSSGVSWRVRGSFVDAFVEFRKDFKVGVRISGREFREFRRFDAFFGIRSLVAPPFVKRLEPLSFAVGE